MFSAKHFISGLFILGIAIALVAVGWGWYQLQPVSATQVPATSFEVPKGQSVTRIAQRLAEAGLIRHPQVFRLIVWQEQLGGKLQAGSFQLSPAMSPLQIAKALTQGTTDVWVTILEGWRREEIAETLAEAGLPKFDKQEFLELTKNDEGKLFPDTYLFPQQATAQLIVGTLHDTYAKKVTKGLSKEIAASKRDFNDVLVLASIVQREARGLDQMKIVAGILWNRVDISMALNADATLQYIKGYDRVQKTWWPEPLAADKAIASPYNTYLHAGLPPKPIANPGLEAIQATLQPTQTEYLYYLHDPRGGLHYATTLEGHNANIRQFLE